DPGDRDLPDGDQRGVTQPQPGAAQHRQHGHRSEQHAHTERQPPPGDHVSLHSAGSSTGPSTCISASSATPNRSFTRRRPSAMTAITSAVLASPWFSTKFACLAENPAPPIRSPRQPAASSSWPALRPSARGSDGFLKVDPNVLMPEGWAALRRARMSASVALTSWLLASCRAKDARATTSPGRRLERRYAKPSWSGTRRSVPAGPT